MSVDQSNQLSSDEASSARLAALVDQLLAEARTGADVDIERIAAQHPDLATDLRELWPVAALAEEFGSQPEIRDEEAVATSNAQQSLNRLDSLGQGIGDYELLEE